MPCRRLEHNNESFDYLNTLALLSPPLFSTEENNEEIVDLTKEESEKIRVEDCEAFQCQMVSFGRQAYSLLASQK